MKKASSIMKIENGIDLMLDAGFESTVSYARIPDSSCLAEFHGKAMIRLKVEARLTILIFSPPCCSSGLSG